MKQLLSLPNLPSARFDLDAITSTIERAFASSGLPPQQGLLDGITQTLRQALGGHDGIRPMPMPMPMPTAHAGAALKRDAKPRPPAPPAPGTFVTKRFANQAGARDYKLYVPARICEQPMPLIVMLHGCTQSPDDFAAGTQMNQLAEQHGFLVVYPEQASNANGSKCWNWFNARDQQRDAGEPSLIAGITREVAAAHRVDPRKIFVAGLSAGGAMAVILGETYPDLYAAVGVHSGLPYAAAHDMPSAFAAMKGGRGAAAHLANLPGAAQPMPARKAQAPVPTIVFHGDRDSTVNLANGTAIVQQAITSSRPAAVGTTQQGTAAGGRTYSRTVHAGDAGAPQIESWVLHGAGHAWSGGHASGSYTDSTGPDASAEMLRFFLGQAG